MPAMPRYAPSVPARCGRNSDVGVNRSERIVQLVGLLDVRRLKDSAHDLHVLLRHRLLLQPHGFEGLLVLQEELGEDEAALTVGVEFGVAASLPARRCARLACASTVE